MFATPKGMDACVFAIGAAAVLLLDCFACDPAALSRELVCFTEAAEIRRAARFRRIRDLLRIRGDARFRGEY